MSNKKSPSNPAISLNKRASHDYFIEQRLEAGLVLKGWEVKSLREAHVQLSESYVLIKNHEAWLLGCHITPLKTVSRHLQPDPSRSRKLLLTHRELSKLMGRVGRPGYTLLALKLYWKNSHVKLEIGLAKGKKEHDKRATLKEQEWQRSKLRLVRTARSTLS